MSIILKLKKIFYLEVILTLRRKLSISLYFISKYFKPHGFVYRRIFLIFLCLKIVLLDPFPANISFAQTNILNTELQTLNSKLETNFNLVKLASPPVSFNTSLLPTTISISSSPISFKLSNSASAIKLSSNPVSLKTSLLPSTLTLSSKPISYSLSKTADLIKLSSLPVSYLLDSFSGELIKLTSAQVSYKTFNGIPILDKVSPNVLPISQNGSTIDVGLGGENFVADATATIGTLKINTKYISSNELTATIPANYLEKENSFELFIANPPPEGGVSKGFNVMVVDPIPIAKINAAPNIGVAPQIVTFDGTETEDLLAKYFGQKLSYSWNFGDDSVIVRSEATKQSHTNPVETYKYEKPGKYLVTLNAVNAYGKTSSITKEIEIRDKNEAPVVDATFTTSESDDYLEVTFDGSMTLDPEGDPISFKWELDGVSSSDFRFSNEETLETQNSKLEKSKFTLNITKKGTFIPKITVTDSLGFSSIKFLDPITYLGPNMPPVAIANISPSEGYLMAKDGLISAFTLPVTLSAKDSFDSDGEIKNYRWIISEGDSSYELEGKELTYEFTKAGEHNVKLLVTDNRNKIIEKTETITVKKPDPIASAFIEDDKTSGEVPLSVQFKSEGSRDFDGTPVNVRWGFGDRSEGTSDPNPIHTYTNPGSYLAELTITTGDGRIKKTTTKTIYVNENNGPQAVIKVLEAVKRGIPNEAMIKLSAQGSFDPQLNQMLSYSWSWTAHQIDQNKNLIDVSEVINKLLRAESPELRGENEEFSYTFTVPGQYTPILEVRTEDGRQTRTNGETITILPGQNPVSIPKIISDKYNGTDTLTVKFDGSSSYDAKPNGQIILYLWEFGDGETSTEISPEYTYILPGEYNAKLTVQDSRGFKASSNTNTVKIVASETTENNLASRTVGPENWRAGEKNFKLQATEESTEDTTFSFSSEEEKVIDTAPPQITLQIDNPDLKAGEVLSFKAHIVDDIGLETVGYKLTGSENSENTILEEIEAAPGNNQIDEFMANVDYIKDILIPENTKEGKYKLLIFAKDKADNWLGKTDSNQIVSSEINVTGRVDEFYSIISEAQDLDSKPDASIISEFDEITQNQSEEETLKLIQIVASDKAGEPENWQAGESKTEQLQRTSLARQYLKQKESINKLLKARTTHLKERQLAIIQKGSPSGFGAPSTMSIVNTTVPVVSPPMATNNSSYIDLSVKGTVPSSSINSYSANTVTFQAPNPDFPSRPYIIKTVNCSATSSCSVNASEIISNSNNSGSISVSSTPIDKFGNPIGEKKLYLLDTDDFDPNLDDSKRTPELNRLRINSQEAYSRIQGQGALTLVVEGSMFNDTSYILWDGIQLDTEKISDKKLGAFVPAHFTLSPKKVIIKVKKIRNNKTFYSDSKDFEIKQAQDSLSTFNTSINSDNTIFGGDGKLLRSGGSVYIDKNTTVFKEGGEITFPFKTNKESPLNIEVTGALIHATSIPNLKLSLDNKGISTLTSTSRCVGLNGEFNCGSNKKWIISLGKINPGLHVLKLSVPDIYGSTIFVLDSLKLGFTPEIKPIITKIEPDSIYAPNVNDRTVTISAKDFGTKPKVFYKGKEITSTILAANKIKVTLPQDLGILASDKSVQVNVINSESNKSSDEASIELRPLVKINTFNINYSFNQYSDTSSLNADISATTRDFTNLKVGIFNKDTKEIINPTDIGVVRNTNLKDTLKASFSLANDLPQGKYYVIALLERNALGGQTDFSDENTLRLFNDLIQKKINNETDFLNRLSFINDKKEFDIGVHAIPTINLHGIYSVYGNDATQEGLELKATVGIKGNVDKSSLDVRLDFGDGSELENLRTSELVKHTYRLQPKVKDKYFEITAKVFYNSTQIGSSSLGITVYKDLPPVAIAKYDEEHYETSGDLPFKAGFIDKSYDPNDEITGFNGLLDKTISSRNIWKLYKYTDGASGQSINTEDLSVTGNQVLNDGKTFLTGNVLSPGTYFTELTVFDRAGNSDTTKSQSFQVLLPTQMLLVYATFDNPNQSAFEYDSKGEVKIQFQSEIDIRGKQPKNIIYKWNFGDVIARSPQGDEAIPNESQPNPIHIYKKGDNYSGMIDYHPDLTVIAVWNNGYSETWTSKAGTISIIDKPEYAALEVIPDVTIGSVPLTVNFMIGEKSIVKNATISSYEFDYDDGSAIESGSISALTTYLSALEELKKKTFTHTYTTKGDFIPTLKVKIKENPDRIITIRVPVVSTSNSYVNNFETIENIPELTIEKEQGDILNLESEVLMLDQGKIVRNLRWQTLNENNESIGEDNYNTDLKENNILIDYNTLPGTYMLRLSQDLNNGNKIEKSLTLIVKDKIAPEIEELELTSGSILASGENLSFKILAHDNAKLRTLNWLLVNNSNDSLVQTGNETIDETTVNKEISFTIPENLNPGDYELVVEVIDISGNTTSSKDLFNLDISILNNQYAENFSGTFEINETLRNQILEGSVSLFALGESTSIFPTLLSFLGLGGFANFIKGKLVGESFEDRLKNQIKDLGQNYIKEVNMILCNRTNNTLDQTSALSNLTLDENIFKATEIALLSASKANVLLHNFNKEFKRDGDGQGRFDILNSQAANVTIINTDDGLKVVSGGDRTDEFGMDSFYLPHLINATKNSLRVVASSRAHSALSILLNNKDLESIFNIDVNSISSSDDSIYKLLNNGYKIIETNFDKPQEPIEAFTDDNLNELGITKLSDFDEKSQNEKKLIVSYVQRLLQDLGISGPTNGEFTPAQLNSLSSITGRSTGIYPQDIKDIKTLASKARSAFLGIRKKDILVPLNREDVYNTFTGTLIGTLASGAGENMITYQQIINELIAKDTTEIIDFILSDDVNELTLNKVSKILPEKIILLISTLLPGERRQFAIDELTQILTSLVSYAEEKGYSIALNDFKKVKVLLASYEKIKDGNEDNIGVLANKFVAKYNVLRDELKDKTESTNNEELASVKAGLPLKLILKIAQEEDKLIIDDIDKRPDIIKDAAYISTLAFRAGLRNIEKDEYDDDFERLVDVGKRRTLLKHLLQRILNAKSKDEVKRAIKELKQERNEAKKYRIIYNPNQILFPLPFDNTNELTLNNKESEVVDTLRYEINTRLNPSLSSNILVPEELIVIIDENVSNEIIETRTVKEIIKDVFVNIYKDKVFRVGAQEAKVKDYLSDNWIREVDYDDSEGSDEIKLFRLNEEEILTKNVISELLNYPPTAEVKDTLLLEQVITEQQLLEPTTLLTGGVNCDVKAKGSQIREVPSEYSLSNSSFTYTVDSLGNATSITLMTSISITNGASNGISGTYSILDSATGMIIYVEPFNIPDPIPVAKYIDLPVKTITGGVLQSLIQKIGTQVLSGLIVIIKIAKPGSPLFVLAAEFLDPEPAGETIPDTFKRPQTAPYINCSPVVQTITSGDSTFINYLAGPKTIPQDVKVVIIPEGVTKKVNKQGIVQLKPTKNTSVTFTTTSQDGTSSAECIVNVTNNDKKPGQIEVNVDDRFVNGYDVNGYPDYWRYPVEYKIDGKLAGEIDYFTDMSTSPTTVTPDQNHTVTLTVNSKDVDNQTKLVPSAPPPISFSFTGGIWRKYTTASGVATSISTNTIKVTMAGDLGDGAYVTNLAVPPDGNTQPDGKSYEIARLLRVFKEKDQNGEPITLSNGSRFSLTNPVPGDEEFLLGNPPDPKYYDFTRTTDFVDYLLGKNSTIKLYENYNPLKETLKFQFVYPTAPDASILNLGTDIPDGYIIYGQ